jgi:hypothetical protein
MLALLVTIRDVLIAAALAWVGVSMEPRESAPSCANDACQQQSD